jgi:hypothetical protein
MIGLVWDVIVGVIGESIVEGVHQDEEYFTVLPIKPATPPCMIIN